VPGPTDVDLYGDPPAGADGPLTGILVLDLTRARSGPTCVRQLADLGAEVIAIVSPAGGGPFSSEGSDGANLQRNKRSMVVDLTTADGREVFLRLAARADVVVENFRPGVKHRLGIDPDAVWAVNPRVVYASISGFGQTGPYADHPGVDQIAQGLGGLMSVTGPPGTGPSRVGIAISDTASGTVLAQGVLAALIARERTGRGQWIHTSLLETMVNFMDFQAARWLIDGEVPGQTGNHHPTIAPMGTFPTADGWINVAPTGDFAGFCALVDAPELATDPRYDSFAGRREHRTELEAAIASVMRRRTTSEWLGVLAGVIPCGPVLAIDEVFADPQVEHLHLTRTVSHPTRGDIEVLRHPVTFSDTPTTIRSGPPLATAHTREVLAELGYDDDQIDALAAAGVVQTGSDPQGQQE
jgi:crotonobetainyl-CoA:carnitine CoA-transferase CaiB-like acyl-CoA transferase